MLSLLPARHRVVAPLLLAACLQPALWATADDLKTAAAHGLSLSAGRTLCETSQLRVQAWHDDVHLVVQAVAWQDGDDGLGETVDGRKIGDRGTLVLDVDGDRKRTPRVDRSYTLNPWPTIPGLRYTIPYERNASSHIKGDSTGRGCIRLQKSGTATVRVDTYVIPLEEIGATIGQTVRLAVLVSSTVPEFVANSVGYKSPRPVYYARSLPYDLFHEYSLTASEAKLDVAAIPAGREDRPAVQRGTPEPMPAVGSVPPELLAASWINADTPPTLASLKGRVVLLDFWATWCGPCVAGIPHLNQLQKKYGDQGLTIVSFTDQSRHGIENFLKRQPMDYVVGTGSQLSLKYGVVGLPHVFLVGRDGRLLWHAVPEQAELDKRIEAVLK
ncbi:MAG: TlpA family protein disulfide reductase [Planctomycetaceae bacterium]|nr:TlpA family protein disulfide reductase [Planctomycetaceae bacterium]